MQRVAGERLLVTRRMIFMLVAVVGLVGCSLLAFKGRRRPSRPVRLMRP